MAKFVVVTVGITILLFLVLIYGYGNFFLIDSIVPPQEMPVEEWLKGYFTAGGVSGLAGFLCSALWYYWGNNYTGGSDIKVKYWGALIVAAILGAVVAFYMIPARQEGEGLAFVAVTILPLLTYFLSSLFASADAVKYIPPLGEVVH